MCNNYFAYEKIYLLCPAKKSNYSLTAVILVCLNLGFEITTFIPNVWFNLKERCIESLRGAMLRKCDFVFVAECRRGLYET